MKKRQRTLDRYKSPEHWDTFEKVRTWKLRIEAMKVWDRSITMSKVVGRINKGGTWISLPYFSALCSFEYIPKPELTKTIEKAIQYYERKVK